MTYEDIKDLTRRTTSDKILLDKVFNIAKNRTFDGYQRGLASMLYIFFDKKKFDSGIKNENISNKKFAEELYKPVIRKLKKRKGHSSFIDNILGVDLTDMQLLSEFDIQIRFLLYVIDIFSKYAWVIPLKNNKVITKKKKKSNHKPNKIWVYKRHEIL